MSFIWAIIARMYAARHSGLPGFIRSQDTVRRVQRPVGDPIPPSPADVEEQSYLDDGVALHAHTLA
jgi:hypothetical protein